MLKYLPTYLLITCKGQFKISKTIKYDQLSHNHLLSKIIEIKTFPRNILIKYLL